MPGNLREKMLNELVDTKDVAERLGVTERTVHTWRARAQRGNVPPTPEPVKYVSGSVPVWWWASWEEWARVTGRLDREAS